MRSCLKTIFFANVETNRLQAVHKTVQFAAVNNRSTRSVNEQCIVSNKLHFWWNGVPLLHADHDVQRLHLAGI